jgi:hypothetical protein
MYLAELLLIVACLLLQVVALEWFQKSLPIWRERFGDQLMEFTQEAGEIVYVPDGYVLKYPPLFSIRRQQICSIRYQHILAQGMLVRAQSEHGELLPSTRVGWLEATNKSQSVLAFQTSVWNDVTNMVADISTLGVE